MSGNDFSTSQYARNLEDNDSNSSTSDTNQTSYLITNESLYRSSCNSLYQNQKITRDHSQTIAESTIQVTNDYKELNDLMCSEPPKDKPNVTVGSSSTSSIPECSMTYTDVSSHFRENYDNPSILECSMTYTDVSSYFGENSDNPRSRTYTDGSSHYNESLQCKSKYPGVFKHTYG